MNRVTKSEKFNKYIKNIDSKSVCEQTFYQFPNGYGASVIYGLYSYGLEVAIINFDKNSRLEFNYSTPLTDDVIGYVEDLDEVLQSIFNLPIYRKEVE